MTFSHYCDQCGALGAGIIVNTGKFPPYVYCSNECLATGAQERAVAAGLSLVADALAKPAAPVIPIRPRGAGFGVTHAGDTGPGAA